MNSRLTLGRLILGSATAFGTALGFAGCTSANDNQEPPANTAGMSDGGSTGGSTPAAGAGGTGGTAGLGGTPSAAGTGGTVEVGDAGTDDAGMPIGVDAAVPMNCGEAGEPCCDGATCTEDGTFCNGAICSPCGLPGSACCPDDSCSESSCCVGDLCLAEGTTCGATLGMCTGGECAGCGTAGEQCCDGSCGPSLECTGAGVQVCTACGGDLQSCCPMDGFSDRCDDGAVCIPTVLGLLGSECHADCGALGQQCCVVLGSDGCNEDELLVCDGMTDTCVAP